MMNVFAHSRNIQELHVLHLLPQYIYAHGGAGNGKVYRADTYMAAQTGLHYHETVVSLKKPKEGDRVFLLRKAPHSVILICLFLAIYIIARAASSKWRIMLQK